jgi:hypothetical protein
VLTPEDAILEAEWRLHMDRYDLPGCLAKTPALRDLGQALFHTHMLTQTCTLGPGS